MVDTNKKIPAHSWDYGEIVPQYGYTFGYQDILGGHKYTYANPAEPEKFSYQKLNASGSYETLEYNSDKNEIKTNLNTGETRAYTAGGSSEQTDGHKDTNVESTSRENVTGDKGVSYKTGYETATEGKIAAFREYKKEFITSASESKSFVGSYGDQVNEHSGNWHESFEKDHVQAVTGNKITMIQKGDYAIHVQSGNYDTHIAEKGRIYAVDDILIESTTKITIKVGGSTVVISPSNITMISDRIDLNP